MQQRSPRTRGKCALLASRTLVMLPRHTAHTRTSPTPFTLLLHALHAQASRTLITLWKRTSRTTQCCKPHMPQTRMQRPPRPRTARHRLPYRSPRRPRRRRRGSRRARKDRRTASIDHSIQCAEQKASLQVSRATATINAERNRALFALSQSASAARQRIAADDKETKKEIEAAATQGGKNIAAASTQAQTDLEAANGKLADANKAEGDARRGEADKQATDAAAAMETSRKKLDGEIAKAWVDDAVAKSHRKMERSTADWAVTDSEAVEAMNNLNSLPDTEQSQAIKQLDKDDFNKLLHEVPGERREEFKSLVDNTHDPERKLELWGEYHKSHVADDAKKDTGATMDEGWWPFESKEQDKNRHLNKIRNQTVSSNNDEVDDELAFLEEKQKAGTPHRGRCPRA